MSAAPPPEVVVCPALDGIIERAADLFIGAGRAAVAERGLFTVALSGGRTPQRLYERLLGLFRAGAMDARSVHFFWGDERCVGPEDAESNYRMAREALICGLEGLPRANVHRIMGELGEAAAQAYAAEVDAFFGAGGGNPPVFDLVLLGMGPDGHIASIFPGTGAALVKDRSVAAVYVEKLGKWRITLTAPVILSARRVVVLAAGAEKAPALKAALEGARADDDCPAAILKRASGLVTWLVDDGAAGKMAR